MIDITTSKVAVPASLFLALSPGIVLRTAGKTVAFADGKTSRPEVMFHALVFMAVYRIVAYCLGLRLTKADLLVTTVLFIALNPGVLVTLPPKSKAGSLVPAVTHAVVFAVVFALLRKQYPRFY
ncbi:MAG: hypothetical protein CL494_04830 [Actinobacteria bacterium]|mgnify:FL=1|nr:hypothetical protein [Actinomycetota bacterium]|tara:strand:- start:8379 stop:8750 length:372 start_codon:yes stop_codon:yes gene_type:complete